MTRACRSKTRRVRRRDDSRGTGERDDILYEAVVEQDIVRQSKLRARGLVAMVRRPTRAKELLPLGIECVLGPRWTSEIHEFVVAQWVPAWVPVVSRLARARGRSREEYLRTAKRVESTLAAAMRLGASDDGVRQILDAEIADVELGRCA